MINFDEECSNESQLNNLVVFSGSNTKVSNLATQSIPIDNNGIIEILCDISEKEKVRLLIDTGASVSLMKVNVLKDSVVIDEGNAMNIVGIFNAGSATIGETNSNLIINGSYFPCAFQIIYDTSSIKADGILGLDFLKNSTIINLRDNVVNFSTNSSVAQSHVFSNPISTKLSNHKTTNVNNDNKGESILRKMGYIPNRGLGKDLQGITEPIDFVLKRDRGGIGSSMQFPKLKEESLEEAIQTISAINVFDDCVNKIKFLPDPGKASIANEIILQPRTECMVQIETQAKGDQFCKAVELEDKVYLGNSVVRPNNGFINLCFVNAKDVPVKIANFKPNLSPLKDFHVYSIPDTTSKKSAYSIKKLRYDKLLQEICFNDNLSQPEIESLKHLLHEYSDIFHLTGDKLTYTNVTKFKIPFIDGTGIVHRRQYRLPYIHKNEVQSQIQKLLDDDVIENSNSPFNSPILLVPKKGVTDDGKKMYRLCVDFRELNKVCVPFSFPLPRIETIVDQLGKSNYFSTLDLSQGFHQVQIEEKDREKTAFSSDYGHYQFKRCPFGLKTMPGFFQSLLNGILTGLQGIKCFIYLDDVVVFGSTLIEHNSKLIEIFDRFRSANLKLNPNKCRFLEKEILFLGHVCSNEGVKPDNRLLKAVQDFPRPTNVKQTQSFLGLSNYYRKFILGFSKIASPLYKLTSKKNKFKWSPECDMAFTELKKALTTPPVLAYPQFDKDFTMTCDASGLGLGAILEQEGRVICYASRSLLPAEKKWSATELELNAIVFGCRTFSCYILGRKVKIYTDHKPLNGNLKVTDTTERIIRLQQKLAKFTYEIIYKRGKDNANADFLSRNPIDEQCLALTRQQSKDLNKNKDKLSIVSSSNKDVIIDSNSDDALSEINPVSEDEVSAVSNDRNKQINIENISDESDKLKILKAFHDAPLGGHFGVSKTYQRIKQKFKWVGMKRDVNIYVKKCVKCQKNKSGRAVRMPLHLTTVSDKPFDKVYIDIVGPLPISLNGNKYILSMVDDLTRFVDFTPMPDQCADTVARCLYEEILCRYSIPKSIVTDNGANFIGNVFKAVCKLLGVNKLRTTAYHPQSNLVERQHSSLGNYLRNFVDGHPTNWDHFLRTAAHAYNNTPHSSTGFCPMELLYGFVSEIPTNLKRKPEPNYSFDDYHNELKSKLQISFRLAKNNLLKAKQTSKDYHDRAINPLSLKVGDKVLIKNHARTSKLSNIWKGPFEVTNVHNDLNISINQGGKIKRIHINNAKKFNS